MNAEWFTQHSGDIVNWIVIATTIYAILTWQYRKLREYINNMQERIDILEERMFWLATGKTLKDALIEEKMKKHEPKTNP